jgi:hypothetical protein
MKKKAKFYFFFLKNRKNAWAKLCLLMCFECFIRFVLKTEMSHFR